MDYKHPDTPTPARAEPRDPSINHEPTPPTTPSADCSSQESTPGYRKMQDYSYHRGHQSLDTDRANWRSIQAVRGSPTTAMPSKGWVGNDQCDHPRTSWRPEHSSIQPNLDNLQRIMCFNNNRESPTVINVASGSYAYCLDRGNGMVTRLIPADRLPLLKEIPRVEPERAGLVCLPYPTAPAPDDVAATHQFVNVANTNASGSPNSSAGSIYRSRMKSPEEPKKEKVYCTKWIHDGTCAFAQTGCRFKHHMPTDKKTQNEVGLHNGLPNWWKKKQAHMNRVSQRLTGADLEQLSIQDDSHDENLPAREFNGMYELRGHEPKARSQGEAERDQRGDGLRSSLFAPESSTWNKELGPIGSPRKER